MGQVGALALVVLGVGVAARAAELTPVNIRMDFIIGGKHAPWFVALEKGFYAKRGLAATIQVEHGFGGHSANDRRRRRRLRLCRYVNDDRRPSRGTPVQTVAQFGYVPRDHLWREEDVIKSTQRSGRQVAGDQSRAGPVVFDAGLLPHQ